MRDAGRHRSVDVGGPRRGHGLDHVGDDSGVDRRNDDAMFGKQDQGLGNRPRAVTIPMIGQRRRMAIATASSSSLAEDFGLVGSMNTTRKLSRPRHVLAVVEIVAVDQGHVARQQQPTGSAAPASPDRGGAPG